MSREIQAKPVRYTKQVVDYITSRIEDGETISKICSQKDQFPDLVPSQKQIQRWREQYPEFDRAIWVAYGTLFLGHIDELEDLSRQELDVIDNLKINPSEESAKDQYYAMKQRIDALKMRIDALKYILAKVAPKFVQELRETPKAAVQVSLPQVNIVHYYQTDDQKLVK